MQRHFRLWAGVGLALALPIAVGLFTTIADAGGGPLSHCDCNGIGIGTVTPCGQCPGTVKLQIGCTPCCEGGCLQTDGPGGGGPHG